MRVSKSILVALVLVVACTTAAMAQNAPGEFLVIYNIQVRSGANVQFEEYIKKVKEAADKTGAPQHWSASQLTFGGPGNNYAIGLRFDKWGEMDGWEAVPQILEDAFGEEEAAKILRSGRMAMESSEITISRLMEDLSYNLKAMAPAPMYSIRVSEIKRDMQQDYRVFLAKANEAAEKAGDQRMVIRRTSTLGRSAVYTSATPFEKWSEWDDRGDFWQRMEKAHGPTETMRLRDTLTKCVEKSTRFTIRMRPDLSRLPMSSTSSE